MKKSKTRIFISKTITSNLLLYIKGKQFHLLKNVLRAKINDKISVFDGISEEWNTIVLSINRDTVLLKVIDLKNKIIKTNDVWLIFAPIKQYRMNIAIQKATELGVSKVIPCITELTNTRKVNIKNLQDNAIEAAEQCERIDIPKIENQVNFKTMFSNWSDDRILIFCDEKNSVNNLIINKLTPLRKYLNKSAILVGPEGGFTDIERESLLKIKKIFNVSLGNKVLRSDTAITVSLFSIEQLLV